jgi:phosphoglycolate phosphatase
MIKAVIFDLDGTLANTMPDLQTAMNNMLSRLGYKTRTKSDLLKAINRGAREFVRRSLPKEVQDVDFILESALETYEEEYSLCYCEKTVPYNGIEALLTELHSRKIKVGVVSNKQNSFVQVILSKLFDKGLIDLGLGQGSMPVKPNPQSTLFCAKELNAKSHQCLYVGDSDVDMETAKNAGMKSIGVSWGYRPSECLTEAGANYIINEPSEILSIIDEINEEHERLRLAAKNGKKLKELPKKGNK